MRISVVFQWMETSIKLLVHSADHDSLRESTSDELSELHEAEVRVFSDSFFFMERNRSERSYKWIVRQNMG